jgi:hypothetical protein
MQLARSSVTHVPLHWLPGVRHVQRRLCPGQNTVISAPHHSPSHTQRLSLSSRHQGSG